MPFWSCQSCGRSLGFLRPDGALRPWPEVAVRIDPPSDVAMLCCPVCKTIQRYRIRAATMTGDQFILEAIQLMVSLA